MTTDDPERESEPGSGGASGLRKQPKRQKVGSKVAKGNKKPTLEQKADPLGKARGQADATCDAPAGRSSDESERTKSAEPGKVVVDHRALARSLRRVRAGARNGAGLVVTDPALVREVEEHAADKFAEAMLAEELIVDPRAWGHKVGKNKATVFARRQARRPKMLPMEGEPETPATGPDAEPDEDPPSPIDLDRVGRLLAEHGEVLTAQKRALVQGVVDHGLKEACHTLGIDGRNSRRDFRTAVLKLVATDRGKASGTRHGT